MKKEAPTCLQQQPIEEDYQSLEEPKLFQGHVVDQPDVTNRLLDNFDGQPRPFVVRERFVALSCQGHLRL